MPTITIALDGPRRRDLKLVAGDQATITLVVYAKDGDPSPVTVTTPTLTPSPDWGAASFPVGSLFTVTDTYPGRHWYRLYGTIGGVRTMLAYGVMEIFGGDANYPSGNDYGWGYWGWGYPW